MFRETTIHSKDLSEGEYNVIFGKAVFDLTDIDSTSLPKTIRIHTVFGSTIVKVSEDLPLKVTGDAVFAGAKLSMDNETVFGELSYTSRAYLSGEEYLHLKSDVVFGALELRTER
jgi:predicted membrane protein